MYGIKHKISNNILFESNHASLKLCVEAAVSARADLTGADLTGADLSGTTLSWADLSGADLSGTYLSEADLSGANLSGAILSGANLSRANLTGADLSRVDLSEANLTGANLSGADLYGINLSRANLSGANLSGANMYGVDGEAMTIKKTPIQISGLRWHVTIFDNDMRIGCEYHSLANWWSYDDARISGMGSYALEFWKHHKAMLHEICAATGRKVMP